MEFTRRRLRKLGALGLVAPFCSHAQRTGTPRRETGYAVIGLGRSVADHFMRGADRDLELARSPGW